ncbi:MAG TPA: methyltransferase domain-containing protein [Acidimicrobiales bacterium]|nr:methyltransferase domain-containing protein [Acidimicrobiales bacterium]
MDEQQRPPLPTDLDELLETLRSRVRDRREAGDYPSGLEVNLEAHFQRIVGTRASSDRSQFRAKLDRLAAFSSFSPDRIQTWSKLPGGSAIHRGVGKVTGRQTQGVLDQVQQFADALRDVLDELADTATDDHDHSHPDLVGMVDVLVERWASYERAPVESAAGMADLHRRIEALEAREARRQFRPWFKESRFAEEFRGSWDELAERYRDLAERLGQSAPVFDLGCGRGEFLTLLKELGIEASGIEIDPELAEEGRGRGLAVEQGDGLAHLATLVDGALGSIVLIQVIEHLTAQEAADLALLARDKLRPGGKLLIETVNPQSLYVFAHPFYVDPTHERPVHPAYLEFLFREAGFESIELLWRAPPPHDDVLETPADDDGVRAANVRRLNHLLFAPQDYALIATR